jgi:hypothetical protein
MDEEDKIRLSAMFDGEATDLEERRFFRDHAPADSALRLARWETVRQVLRGGQTSFFSEAQQVALFEGIHAAIDEEAPLTAGGAPKMPSKRRPIAFAAAASVLLIIGVGLLMPDLQNVDLASERDGVAVSGGSLAEQSMGEPSVREPSVREFSTRQSSTREVASIAFDPSRSGSNELDEVDTNPDLRALDAAGRAKLRAYLQQHDRVSQSGSRQAFVNFPQSSDVER